MLGRMGTSLKSLRYRRFQICMASTVISPAHLITAHLAGTWGGGGQRLVVFSGSGVQWRSWPGLPLAFPTRGTLCFCHALHVGLSPAGLSPPFEAGSFYPCLSEPHRRQCNSWFWVYTTGKPREAWEGSSEFLQPGEDEPAFHRAPCTVLSYQSLKHRPALSLSIAFKVHDMVPVKLAMASLLGFLFLIPSSLSILCTAVASCLLKQSSDYDILSKTFSGSPLPSS